MIAAAIVLQTLHGLSDEAAAEALTFDLRWKAACGPAVTGKGFHPTSSAYRRRRLRDSDRPNRIFDAVATQDTVTQLNAAIRRVAREVPAPSRR